LFPIRNFFVLKGLINEFEYLAVFESGLEILFLIKAIYFLYNFILFGGGTLYLAPYPYKAKGLPD